MWFKNLLIYRFTQPFSLNAEELDSLLAQHTFTPCGSQDSAKLGWVPPIGGDSENLVHANTDNVIVCLQRQEKVLPAAVVNEFLAERVQDIKENEERGVGRKERFELKDQIIFELLPRAFSRTKKLYAYIDRQQGLLVIDTTSYTRAEELMNALREAVGSLPLLPIKARNIAEHSMTNWLQSGQTPENFTIGGECELRDKSDDSAVIRCKNQDLSAREITSHLDSGMYVNKLELNWNGGIECVVDSKLAIKKLKFDDLITDKASDVETESSAEQFDVDFAIMTGEFAKFIPVLISCFGGFETEQ